MPNMGFLGKMAQNMINKHLKDTEITCDRVSKLEQIDDPNYQYRVSAENCRATFLSYDFDLGNLTTKANIDDSVFVNVDESIIKKVLL